MKNSVFGLLLLLCFRGNGFSQSFNKAKMDSLFDVLASKEKAMGSIAVSKNGNLLYTRAIGNISMDGKEIIPADVNTKYRIGSITKMFTAVIIFQLVEEKKLGLDDKLDKYYPAVPNANKISIADMLRHQSGIHNFTDDSTYFSYYYMPHTQQSILDIITATKPDFEPGTETAYSNSNYVLLGYIAEMITGKKYDELVKQRIIKKIPLTNTYVGGKTDISKHEAYSYHFISSWEKEIETDMSVPAGAGSIVSTATDLTKFIEALFNGKLIDTTSLANMKTIKNNFGMGMFQIPFYEKRALGHSGSIDGFVSNLAYFPEDSLAIAYCSNGVVYPVNDIMIGILSICYNKKYSIPTFTKVELSNDDIMKYLGEYASDDIPLKITIGRMDNTLIAQATGQSSFPLEASAKDIFKFDPAGIAIEFDTPNQSFTLKQGGKKYLFKKE
ncbi:MAG: beta-lactamase family protein [Bacteroidetes bacterium]|nr:beta-lactamase family protein [Bacteroidota bacterium]